MMVEPEDRNLTESNIVDEQDYHYEEPSRWDRFVTNISSTNCLIDTYSVPNSRKLCYLFVSITIFILSIPLGWIFLVFLVNKLQGALKQSFFPNNISEFDIGSDYSKAKCWGIISIPIIVIFFEILIILFSTNKNYPPELKEYVFNFNANAPYSMMGGQIDSVELDNNNLILFCNVICNQQDKRLYLNNLNVELWKPILCGQDSIINENGYLKNYIFRFGNNGIKDADIVVPSLELKEYRRMSNPQKANKFLNSYISLEKEFIPYFKNNGVLLKDINISKSGEGFDTRHNLKYVMEDSSDFLLNSGLSQDSIKKYIESQLPLNYPYLLESIIECADGVSYQIDTKAQTGKEIILFTSDEIKNKINVN